MRRDSFVAPWPLFFVNSRSVSQQEPTERLFHERRSRLSARRPFTAAVGVRQCPSVSVSVRGQSSCSLAGVSHWRKSPKNQKRTLGCSTLRAEGFNSLAGFDHSVRRHVRAWPDRLPFIGPYRSGPVLWNSTKRQSWPATSRPATRCRTTGSQCFNAVASKTSRPRV